MRQRIGVIGRLAMAWHLAAVLLFPGIAAGQDSQRTLKSGWYPWDPYQHVFVKHDVKRLMGLDVQLVRAVFAEMGYEVAYEEVSWKQHQSDLKNGVRDIAAGASRTLRESNTPTFPRPTAKRPMFCTSAKEKDLGIRSKTRSWYTNLLDYKPTEISLAVVVTLIGALLTRMAGFHLRVKSPMY